MNKKIALPKCQKLIEYKTEINGAEWEDIQAPIMNIRFEIQESGKGSGGINVGEAKRSSNDIAVGIVIQSVDNKPEGILEAVRNLSAEDYRFVLDLVDGVVTGEDFLEKGKEPSGGTG